MAQRNRAAVDVQPVQVQAQLAAHGQGLRALGFVDFKTRDVAELQAGTRQQQTNGWRRANAHDVRRHADHGRG